MKIKLLTFSLGDSFGAIMQAYALSYTLRKMGHEVELFNLTWYRAFKQQVYLTVTGVKHRFSKFRKNYLPAYTKKCKTNVDLYEASKGADLCIVGSDQVWNPQITHKYALNYFFDFLDSDTKRGSYAASFGDIKWNYPEYTIRIQSLLNKFSFISSREETGVDICTNIFNADCVKVVDPTLLLPSYIELLKGKKKKTGIVSFSLSNSVGWNNLLSDLSNQMSMNVYVINPITSFSQLSRRCTFRYKPFITIESWLRYIYEGEIVVTDSFHGLVFAILFNRNFISISPGRDERIKSLLNSLGLENRFYNTIMEVDNCWKEPINWEMVNDKLAHLRQESLLYLENCINRI